MRKSFLVLILVVASLFRSYGQDGGPVQISLGYPVYSQYLQNGMMINPAYAGTRGALSTFLSYRLQWMNMPGSPVMQTASLHMPTKRDKVGLGLVGRFMQFGRTNSSSFYLAYAYHIRMGKGKLSLGLQGGFDRSSTNYSDIILATQGDPVFTSDTKPYMLPNVSAGAYYFSDRIFAGVAVPAFLSYNKTSTGSAQAYHSFNNYDLVFTAGGLVSISGFLKFKPSVLVDYSLNKAKGLTQLDINGNFIFTDIVWLGGSWRTTEEVLVGILQFQLNPQLMIGMSYDYPAGRMKTFKTGGSSEFTIRYEFGYKVSASSPRYF